MVRIQPVLRCACWLAAASVGLVGCTDDEKSPRDDAGMDAGLNDAGSDGGRDGGTNPLDASSPLMDSGSTSDYRCQPPPGPNGTLAAGASCCSGLGVCEQVDAAAGTFAAGDCNAAAKLRCAAIPQSGGAPIQLAHCRMQPASSGDAGPDYEGRCIPECLTRGIASLSQGQCTGGFVCVPCYSVVTGQDTGACRNGGDQPAEPPPPGFDECGDGLGYCIAPSLVPAGQTMLPALTCDGGLCAPKQRVLVPNSCFAHCTSIGGIVGACVPAFLVPENNRASLPQDECLMGELCSPCINPLTQQRTRACD